MRKLFATVAASMVMLCAGIIWSSSAQAESYEGVTYTSSACGVVDIVNGRSTEILVEFKGVESPVPAGGSTVLSDPGQEELTFTLFVDRGVSSTITYATACEDPEPGPDPEPTASLPVLDDDDPRNKPKASDDKEKVTYVAPKTGATGDAPQAPFVLMGLGGVALVGAFAGIAWRRFRLMN